MAFDTKKWLTDIGFSAEEAADLAPKFEPRVGELEKHQLRQADYSRAMNEVQKLQTELRANSDRLNREMAEFATIQAGQTDQQDQIRGQLEKTQLEKFQLEQALIRVAEQNGLDPRTLVPNPSPEPDKKPEPEPFDPGKVTAPIMQTIGSVADFFMNMQAELPAIMLEHQALTGETLDTRAFVAELKTRAQKKEDVDPRRLWESLYDIPAKREAQRQANYDKAIKDAEQRGRESARSEMAIPGAIPATGHNSPVFTRIDGGASKLPRPASGSGVEQFAQSLATHKYRQSPTPIPAGAK